MLSTGMAFGLVDNTVIVIPAARRIITSLKVVKGLSW
jgi:hypothetical protein